MLHIKKERMTRAVEDEINRVKRNTGWNRMDYTDCDSVRTAFDQLDKRVIREQLLKEQHYLCGYCMRRIREDNSVIEHLSPINRDGAKALSYENMIATCDGGRGADEQPKVLCCDASKGNQEISISPYNRIQMEKIRYNKDGMISVPADEIEMARDINEVLKLNGVLDENGKLKYDTATQLVHGRRQTIREFCQYMQKLESKKRLNKKTIQARIDEICDGKEYVEFAGVWMFFLERSIRQQAVK